MQSYGPAESGMGPMYEWTHADIQAHIEFQIALNQELGALGELIDAQGLAGPDQACFVVSNGLEPPVVSDGPFPETKELIAGYRLVEVGVAGAGHRDRSTNFRGTRNRWSANSPTDRSARGHERAARVVSAFDRSVRISQTSDLHMEMSRW